MGRVMARLKLTNFIDEEMAIQGLVDPSRVRRIEIEALVDTGATMLVLPADVVQALGLRYKGTRPVRYANGTIARIPWVSGVMLEVLGRGTVFNALVEAAGTTALIGQIPLEELDLIVDPKSREVRVNPASPDAPLLEILLAS
jgi:clan AA aspartic protease